MKTIQILCQAAAPTVMLAVLYLYLVAEGGWLLTF